MIRSLADSVSGLVLAGGVTLRTETAEDHSFLEKLFVSIRWREFDAAGWPDEVRSQFLAQQASLQHRHYLNVYGDGAFRIIERDGHAIGRLYLHDTAEDIRIVDISLVESVRGAGLGTALLSAILELSQSLDKSVSIHVERNNPAKRLYERLGFVAQPGDDPYLLMECRHAARATHRG